MLARVAWSPTKPKKVAPRRLTRERRRVLTEKSVDILRNGFPTLFALEGAVRHGLRASLCLAGWSWASADAEAAKVVAAAFRMLGATRPTWDQGQPEHTAAGTELCTNCGKPMPDRLRGDGLDPRKYCSKWCRDAWNNWRYRESHREELAAYQRALRASRPYELVCQQCGRTWRTSKKSSRFCSIRCSNLSRADRYGDI